MSAPSSPGTPPLSGSAAPPSPPPPVWAPSGGPWLPAARHDVWGLISLGARAVGYLLVFIGAIAIVAAVSVPGTCYTDAASCGVSWLSNAATWTIVGKILAVLGLAFLGFGAAVKLHFGLRLPASGNPDEIRFIAAERRVNGAIFVASFVLLILILITVNVGPSVSLP